jgi:hypothetical protein
MSGSTARLRECSGMSADENGAATMTTWRSSTRAFDGTLYAALLETTEAVSPADWRARESRR